MKKIVTLTCMILLLHAFSSVAEDNNRVVLDEKLVMETGLKIADFVPKGWKIEQELKGRLNPDSLEDIVLQLVEDNLSRIPKVKTRIAIGL